MRHKISDRANDKWFRERGERQAWEKKRGRRSMARPLRTQDEGGRYHVVSRRDPPGGVSLSMSPTEMSLSLV